MTKFQTNVCPLCDKVLQFRQIAKVNVYSCPNHADGARSHYEVEYDKHATIQHIYVGDYGIDNFDTSYRSRVYKKHAAFNGEVKWILIGETNRISADTEDKLIMRLKQLGHE